VQNPNGKIILDLKRRIEEDFTHGDWEEVGLLTDCAHIIDRHDRLLRSLHFGDEDYSGNVISVLKAMAEYNESTLATIESFLNERYPDQNMTYISSKPAEKKITFSPTVFSISEGGVEDDLVAVMMPFAGFDDVYEAIKNACLTAGLRCVRADDIWENSTIIQDIFSIIYRARIVVVDYSNKNPNVMYETGIAHTLGKIVVPLAQSISDVPSDTVHHRALLYLKNGEGVSKLSTELARKLGAIKV
jgi:hypothetical protein